MSDIKYEIADFLEMRFDMQPDSALRAAEGVAEIISRRTVPGDIATLEAALEERSARCRILEDDNEALKRALENQLNNDKTFRTDLVAVIQKLEAKADSLTR